MQFLCLSFKTQILKEFLHFSLSDRVSISESQRFGLSRCTMTKIDELKIL